MSSSATPKLTALSLPASVDIGSRGAPLTLSATAAPGTQIDYLVAEFDRGLIGPAGLASFVYVDDTGGQDWAQGPVSATITVAPEAEPGRAEISRLWVWEEGGRSTLYTGADLAGFGLDTGVDVVGGTADAGPPTLDGLSLTGSVDVSGGTGVLTATLSASDDTEVSAVELVFEAPVATDTGLRTALLVAAPEADFAAGAVSADLTLTDAAQNGPVTLAGVRVWDIHGNAATYLPPDLTAAGFDTGFDVTGGVPDLTPPALTNLGLPGDVDISGGATTLDVTLTASDPAGIAYAQVYLDRGVAGIGFDYLSYYVAPAFGDRWEAGPLTRSFAVGADAVPGPVTVREVHIFDTQGNGRIYDRAELTAKGMPTAFRIETGAPPPALSFTASVTETALVLRLAADGAALPTGPIDLDFTLDGTGLGTPIVEQVPPGTVTIRTDSVGGLLTLDLTADLNFAVQDGTTVLEIKLPAQAAAALAPVSATVVQDGAPAALPPLPPILLAGPAGDALTAGALGSALIGRSGDDTLTGGIGDDTLTGGAGADLFVTAPGGGTDRIADFTPGEDLLDLRLIDRDTALAALAGTGAGPAELDLGGGAVLTLDGLTQDEVSAAHALIAPAPRTGAVWAAERVTVGAEPVTVVHGWRFDAPVAFAGPPGANEGQPGGVRILAVTPSSVTLVLDRPPYLAEPPAPQEVTLFVAEDGVHRLPDGRVLQAGTLETGRLTPQGFERVDYAEAFGAAPAALSQVQSAADPAYVFTRQTGADETGLELALQSDEAGTFGNRAAETVGWLALDTGGGLVAVPGQGPVRTEAGRTGPDITDGAGQVGFAQGFQSAPGLVAALSSFAGPDPARLDLAGLEAAGFEARAVEDRSLDAETAHTAETADFIATALPGGAAAAIGQPLEQIGEVHRLTVSGGVQTVNFSGSYDRPVIVAQGASFNGSDPVTVRLLEVTGSSARLRLQEPNYLDDLHTNESVTLLVMEAGRHVLADGTRIEAGLHITGRLTSAGFDNIRYEAGFDAAPVLLSTVMTNNGPDWVITRHDAVGADGFSLALQEEEALNGGGHANEEVGWVAIESGGGTWSGIDWQAGSATGIHSGGVRADFATAFDTAPGIVANLATVAGIDPAAPRLSSVDSAGFTALAQEEASFDAEIGHASERLDYLAFESAGALSGFTRAPVIAEAGSIGITHTPVTIALGHRFDDPVVFAAATTANGGQPAAVRVVNLTADSLTLAMQEPLWLDGAHALEEVSWLVVEAGSWALADGTRLDVGTTTASARGPAGLTDVSFASPFAETPVTFAQVQALPAVDFLDTRQTGASPAGFRVTVEGEEARNTLPQPPQEVGWLAVERGTALWEGEAGAAPLLADTTGQVVTNGTTRAPLDAPFDAAPLLLAQMASYAGVDPAVLRASGLDAAGVDLRIQEDQSADAELGHTAEDVALIGLGGSGLLLGDAWTG